jgi:hypothetical protein
MLVGVAAPVLYWEQGHEWLFGDPVRFQVAQNYLKQDMVRVTADWGRACFHIGAVHGPGMLVDCHKTAKYGEHGLESTACGPSGPILLMNSFAAA